MESVMKTIQERDDIEKIYKQLSEIDYISFDVFDTLLKRNVLNPKDVFVLMEYQLNYKYPNFSKRRVEAERQARQLSSREEITLAEIYQCFNGIEKKDIDKIINLELEIEKSVLTINKDILPIYKDCLKKGKTIYIISDMYIDIEMLEDILKEKGIFGYKKIYLSSQYKLTKRSGNLYKKFLKDENIQPENVIHIGDSYVSDKIIPQKIGIHAVHIPTHKKRSYFKNDYKINTLEYAALNEFINNTVDKDKNLYYRFGYEKFGMFLWGYALWLKKELDKNKIKKIYFFSRDGLIIKKAFDMINKNEKIESFYLQVSRRSLRVPILWQDSRLDTLLNMLSPSKFISLKMIFDGVGLDIEQNKELINRYGFKADAYFDRNSILKNQSLLKMYQELTPKIIENSKKEFKSLVQYIKENKLNGKFAVVDIGWSGGMQRYLQQTLQRLNIDYEIYGYYIGVATYYNRNIQVCPDLYLKGYLFDFKNKKNERDKRSSFVGLFETFFLEQHGSVKCYELTNKGVQVVRYPYEYEYNGKPTKEYKKVKIIQKGALEFILNIEKSQIFKKFNFTPDQLFAAIYETGTNPKKIDMDMFSDFKFYDEGEVHKLAGAKCLLYYLIHIKNLKKDFLSSRWKIGFMKKLFIIYLPYQKIYDFLCKYK